MHSVFAYENVFTNFGTATTTNGSSYWLRFDNASTISGTIEIDCDRLGISEIASTTVHMWSASGAPMVQLADANSGAISSQNYSVTTTGKPISFAWSPAIWCQGKTVRLIRYNSATAHIYAGLDGNVNDVISAGVWTSCIGACFSTTEYKSRIPAIVLYGSFATSTVSYGDTYNSTTTYAFNFSTSTLTATSSSLDMDYTNTLLLTFGLLATLAGSGIFAYNMVYGRRRTA